MRHRILMTGLFGLAGALISSGAGAAERVETPNAILSLEEGSGDLVGVLWKHPKLDVIADGRLGENFRILIPKSDYEANYFNSRDQSLRRLEKFPDRVVLHYGPLKNEREEVNVTVAYEIRDTGTQLNFSIRVDNATDRPLAEVVYGLIGGQRGIGNRLETDSHVPGGHYANLAPKLFSQFRDFGEDVGHPFYSTAFAYPGTMAMGWMDVYNLKTGVGYYYANQDSETRVTSLYAEMHPYATRSTTSNDNWPSSAALPSSEPLGLTLGWVYFPYTKKGAFHAGPIALQVHEGDWHQAATIYRTWFDQHFTLAREPSWLRKEMAWQALALLNPEDLVLHRFNDLPKLASEAKQYGVTTLELYGWNVGGIDRGYPNYALDPRLGTREEFRKALAAMRAIGVHPLLFGKTQVADTSTNDFSSRLSRYAVQGRWAPDLQIGGYGEATIGARMWGSYGRTLHRNFAFLSLSHPKFREEIVQQYLDRLDDGGEGLALDDTDALDYIDFNPAVPTSPDRSVPHGVLTTLEELLSRARSTHPEAAIAATYFDRALPDVEVSRMYMFAAKDVDSSALRYTFPERTSIVFVESPENFGRLNNGLRYGLVWDIAARNYTASLDEPLTRPLSRYLSELIRIRKQYAQLLFHGRFNDTFGAQVVGDNDDIRYSVFTPRDVASPERACVVVNFGNREASATVSFAGKDGRPAKISVPFQPDRVDTLPVKLTLPPQRAAVVIAQ